MGERLIKPYEISVWEDKLIQGNFIENKLAVIGSDTMTGLNKVYDPVFNKKSNGEKTLTFSLKYKYFDPYTGNSDFVNPFAALLINERKVKLHYDNQWYEFIIKDHTESSDGLEWTYTCTDAFVLELSKNGYNITFDSELNNNQGTAYELAKETLKDTDWQVGGANVGKQLVAEPIYKAKLVSTTGIDIINANTGTTANIAVNTDIYVFYSYVKNQNGKFVQFIIRDGSYTIDDNNVITDDNYRITTDLTYDSDSSSFKKNTTSIIQLVVTDNGQSVNPIETEYQANRLVYNQLTTYDPVMGRTVDIFKSGDKEVYRYTDYLYTTSNIVTNFITNGDNFNVLEDGTLQGWNPYVDFTHESEDERIDKLELVTRPELGTDVELADISQLSQIEGFLKVKFKGTLTLNNDHYENAVYNSGIENNVSFINSIAKGDQFVFRWRAGVGELDSLVSTQQLRLVVAKYTQDAPTWGYYYKHFTPDDIILQFNGEPQQLNNIISGGTIDANDNYVIDDVIQTPSTKYIYKVDNSEYVWNALTGSFEAKTSSNYIPYYYLTATAIKSVSNAVLTDPTEKIGIFIYHVNTEVPACTYYIQDVQLTRFIPDEQGNPIIMGNVPTATSVATEYYYLKPMEGTAAEDIETYTSASELGLNDLEPVYNEDSEKVLSISVSKSNCFNILQTIAETFECWVDLVVGHDSKGYITSTNDRPNKYVYLREYIGKDNWSGFKYGINIQSIERTVNSDEIVTKLMVDQSQSDYVDEGFIFIANAPSNQSGEAYILNFNYYYNQGLLDRNEAEKDRLALTEALAQKNNELQVKEKERNDLKLSLTTLNSKRTVYSDLVTTAEDTQSRTLAEFEQLTGQAYEDYRAEHISLEDDDQLTEEDTILDILGELYTSSATINNYAGILTNIEQEYWKVRKQLYGSENFYVKIWVDRDINNQRHVCVELNDYLPDFSFTLGSQTEAATVNKKYWDITSNASSILFTAPTGYTITEDTYTINDNKIKKIKISSSETYPGIEDDIEDILDEKNKLTKEFNNKYSRFIQEGTWSSTDYIDSELYYLDALQVSNTSAQPTVSYTINVVEISELEGFEDYLFDAGDKTYIEDTEFFGWTNVGGTLTPAREEVIVSEVEWHLDDPSQNIITVQNYKTRFEDLFQRISAAVQTVQYNEATYAKISSLLDANGTINQNVLLASLNKISGQEYNLTSDGSVVINGDMILIQNLTNRANRVILNSEGIQISSDGGQTWRTVLTGEGIDIGTVYTGVLNTQSVVIGNDQNPSFRWDKSGISAYKSNQDGSYDLKTYVRYDEYGLYGIKNNGTFKANSLQDVLDKAHFAVTWDGFFIKNDYPGGGRVEITSDNDFRILKKVNGEDKEVIKIGALEWDGSPERPQDTTTAPSLYGIRITNDEDVETFKTGTDGNIEITGTINATGGNFSGIVNVGPTNQDHIVIDGRNVNYNPSIHSSNYQDGAGYGWMINKDGDAVFNNITARGAIKTAVFEYAEIQAVGGIFIFRPSSTIKSAKVSGDNLIVKVEKPLLFAKVTYNEVSSPTGNPNAQEWYERTNYGYQETSDTSVVSGKTYYVKNEVTNGSWCKVSNYTADGVATDSTIQNILLTNGLTHVYQISNVNSSTGEVTLIGAAVMVTGQNAVTTLEELEGGALIDMGRSDGSSNYGIGVNSSDNTVNLPRRAISLFETVINENANPKVSYRYRGILGTLPALEYTGQGAQVSQLYHDNLEGTQGIYTDNIYIGDHSQYFTYYTEAGTNKKRLKIRANQFEFEVVDDETGESEWKDISEIEAEQGPQGPAGPAGADAITVKIESNVGNELIMTNEQARLTCTVYQGNTDITNTVTRFTWTKLTKDGTPDTTWNQAHANYNNSYLDISASDINIKAIFNCHVLIPDN